MICRSQNSSNILIAPTPCQSNCVPPTPPSPGVQPRRSASHSRARVPVPVPGLLRHASVIATSSPCIGSYGGGWDGSDVGSPVANESAHRTFRAGRAYQLGRPYSICHLPVMLCDRTCEWGPFVGGADGWLAHLGTNSPPELQSQADKKKPTYSGKKERKKDGDRRNIPAMFQWIEGR